MYIGIDVSKERLDVYGTTWESVEQYSNNVKGVDKLVKRIMGAAELVVMESTGGYERLVSKRLQAEGVKVAVMNPWQTSNFGKSLGLRAKTDLIDAEVLARFGAVIKPNPTKIMSDKEFELKQLVLRRTQLVDQRVRERNRLDHASPLVKKSIEKMIKFLRAEVRQIGLKIEKLVADNPEISEKARALRTANGIGAISAYTFCFLLPEIGSLNRKQIAALAGVAPYNNDSGGKTGQRSISGGRAEVRSVLYMATLTATRCNPKIKKHYKKLIAKGKKKKVALVACMRKFLVCLNAMLKANQTWNQKSNSVSIAKP